MIKYNKINKLTQISVFLSLALIIGIIEKNIPPFIPIPYFKIGLSNCIILSVIYIFSMKEALIIVMLKSIILGIYSSGIISIIYSMTAGIISVISMFVIIRIFKESVNIISVSVLGAVIHNMVQVLVGAFVLDKVVLNYMPLLIVIGVVTGFFTGIIAYFVVKHYNKIPAVFE